MPGRKQWITMAACFGLVAALDAVTKVLAEEHLSRRPFVIVPDWVALRLAYNKGVAFSALEGAPHWAIAIGAVTLLGIVVWSLRELMNRTWGAVALALVSAGGIANQVDRIFDGRVTDMISVWKWPVFNVADSGITVGVAILLLVGWKKPKPAPAAPADEAAARP